MNPTTIEVLLSHARPEAIPCDAIVLFVPEEEKKPLDPFSSVNQKLNNALATVIKDENFKGKLGETIVFHSQNGLGARRVILVGAGKKAKWSEEMFRRAAGSATLAARNTASSRLVFSVPAGTGLQQGSLVCAIAEGALLAAYRYLKFKTKQEEIEPDKKITSITMLASGKPADAAIQKAQLLADATCFARDLVNEPANALNPQVLAEVAKKVAKQSGLTFRVLEVAELEKLGAGAILGVGQGSTVPPRLITLSYSSGKKNARKLALVGKGITFDSGGLSLKSAKYMETMKCDMAGAAAVLAAMRALPSIKPGYDILAVLCAAENMPSGSAIRPGDVLKAMNGKSIEVINTDAEGRLVLSDGISWAVKQGANEIIDLATLTGAVVIGLGPYIAGVLGNDQKVIQNVIRAGNAAGEAFWELPIPDEYDFMIKSDIADMKNLAANSEAGATQGALLLREFVGDAKWAHLDIAGPAWYEKEFFYIPKNGTGFGVRTLIEYLSK